MYCIVLFMGACGRYRKHEELEEHVKCSPHIVQLRNRALILHGSNNTTAVTHGKVIILREHRLCTHDYRRVTFAVVSSAEYRIRPSRRIKHNSFARPVQRVQGFRVVAYTRSGSIDGDYMVSECAFDVKQKK